MNQKLSPILPERHSISCEKFAKQMAITMMGKSTYFALLALLLLWCPPLTGVRRGHQIRMKMYQELPKKCVIECHLHSNWFQLYWMAVTQWYNQVKNDSNATVVASTHFFLLHIQSISTKTTVTVIPCYCCFDI